MLDKEPEVTIIGHLKTTNAEGPALPPGISWLLEPDKRKWTAGPIVIDQLLRAFEGKEIQIDITILEDIPPEPRRVRTIRDLTEPR